MEEEEPTTISPLPAAAAAAAGTKEEAAPTAVGTHHDQEERDEGLASLTQNLVTASALHSSTLLHKQRHEGEAQRLCASLWSFSSPETKAFQAVCGCGQHVSYVHQTQVAQLQQTAYSELRAQLNVLHSFNIRPVFLR
ncbi:hypothetical protein QOT17_018157, partial [Balamuthia mandrillaris]